MIQNRYIKCLKSFFFIIAILPIIYSSVAFAVERYAVIGKVANIRSGPGTKHEILCTAEKYYPIIILKKSGNWYRVEDFEGDVGWIHKSLVKKIQSVITTKPKCNIRSGPDLKYQIVFISKDGVPFKVIKKKGEWIHVQHADGHKGWIHKSLVW
ncbi:SH3 domain-containing protein [Thermodesulfobacteriota bacterium]